MTSFLKGWTRPKDEARDLTLDAGAVGAVFSVGPQVFVASALLDGGLDADAFGLAVTRFDEAGRLSLPGREPSETVTLPAVPHDVVAVVGLEADGKTVDALRDVFAAHDTDPMPEAILLGSASDLAALAARLIPATTARLAAQRLLAGTREAEVARLRREAEWHALQLRVGREMVEAIGFSTRTLAYEALPGERTIGPGAASDVASDAIVQRLPVDASGLTGVSLHVAATGGDGRYVISIADPSGASLARTEIAFSDLAEGWNDLVFDAAIGAVHGDAFLHITAFTRRPDDAPRFDLSARETSRFGLERPKAKASLALRAWKGLSPQAFAAGPPPRRLERHALDLGTATPLAGGAAAAILQQRHGAAPLAHEGEALRLRTAGETGGARLDGALPEATTSITARLAASEDNAGALKAVLLALPETAGPDALQAALAEAGTEGTVRGLAPGEAAELSLTLEPLAEPHTLCVAFWAEEASVVSALLDSVSHETVTTASADRPSPFARRVSFPEIKTRTGYLWGSGEGMRANEEGGAPVVQVSDLESFLQTHPLPGALTGARITGVLPLGLTRVAARVVTAHSQGPTAEYGLFVVPVEMGLENPDLFRRAFEAAAEAGWRDLPEGVIAHRSWVVPPGRPMRLALDLPRLAVPADLFCTIRSTNDHTAYGWCRWTALDMVVEPGAARAHDAETTARA